MSKKFEIPLFYRSPIISGLKAARRVADERKKELSPTVLDCGPVRFKIARHFGFCYGVENAIEIAYRAIAQNPGKRVFLLSEMIHNPRVNADLKHRGVSFLCATDGSELLSFEELTPADVVIVPAFGTTRELFAELRARGINPQQYNATCPFVEKVWKRSEQLGAKGYTVIIHGKHYHEETRATFSHARVSAPSLIVRDIDEAQHVVDFLLGRSSEQQFNSFFEGKLSPGFLPSRDLVRIGVVNQTTMLASETQAISDLFRATLITKYGAENVASYFADTRDTLCYATYENQEAVEHLVASGGDLALVVGGYKSSNTFHLMKKCEGRVPTFYIEDAAEILSADEIRHLEGQSKSVVITSGWIPKTRPLDVLVTAGASCPDALVDEVLTRVADLLGTTRSIQAAAAAAQESLLASERTLRTSPVAH